MAQTSPKSSVAWPSGAALITESLTGNSSSSVINLIGVGELETLLLPCWTFYQRSGSIFPSFHFAVISQRCHSGPVFILAGWHPSIASRPTQNTTKTTTDGHPSSHWIRLPVYRCKGSRLPPPLSIEDSTESSQCFSLQDHFVNTTTFDHWLTHSSWLSTIQYYSSTDE